MTIEERLSNLENLVNHLSQMVIDNKFYTDADMQGNRQSISNVTPYTETKTAYIGDTNCGFNTPTDGNVSVFFDKNVNGYRVEKDYYARRIVVVFDEPLEEVTEVTISIS